MLARWLQGAAKRGEIQYVGGNSGNSINGGSVTVSLTALTGGLSSSAQAGDLVIAAYCEASLSDTTMVIRDPSSANYTLIFNEFYANGTTSDTNLRVAYKRLTAADASVTFVGSASTNNSLAGVVHVYRGVHATTPLDVTATGATGTGTGRPNPASITPVTPGAKIIIVGASATQGTAAAYTAAYLSNLVQAQGSDTFDAMIGMGRVDWTSGAYDGAQFTGGTTATGDSWASMSIALRPA